MRKKSKKMEFIDFARLYSIEILGLNKDHSFEKLNKHLKKIYVVNWSPKDELKLDYKTFESKFLALKFKKSLRNCYVYLRGAEAIGDSNFPITASLLRATPSRIALTIPHEKWHCFVDKYRHQENFMIDESCGDAIGINEAINIVENFYGKSSDEYKEAINDRKYYRKKAKISKMLVEELNELYGTKDFDERNVKMVLKKYNKLSERLLDCKFDSVAEALEDYSYEALYPLTEDIYMKHGYEKAKKIFISSLKKAEKIGFNAGVKELLRYSDLDEEEYLKAINVFR